MTIHEALDRGIRFVRLPHWEPTAHIELPILPNGQHGPWAIVRDVTGEQTVFIGGLRDDTDARYVTWYSHPAVDASDPHATSPGNPSTRD